MEHAGILAHSVEGAALCLRAFAAEGFRELGPHAHPDVTLDCIALADSMPAWETGDYPAIRTILARSAARLAAAGASFFVCPDNSAHLALEQPGEPLPFPGLHIAAEVADRAARDGRRRVGILGTRFTMEGWIYPREFAGRGVDHRAPEKEDRAVIDGIIFNELVNGVFSGASRREYVRVIEGPPRRRLRRGRTGVHRDPPADRPRHLAPAGPGFHPPARACRLRGRGRAAPDARVAGRPARRLTADLTRAPLTFSGARAVDPLA
jgi:aspartate/glutamate racemase